MNNEHITEIIGISLGNNYIYDNNSGDLPLLYVAVGEPHYRGVIGRYRWGIGGLLGPCGVDGTPTLGVSPSYRRTKKKLPVDRSLHARTSPQHRFLPSGGMLLYDA